MHSLQLSNHCLYWAWSPSERDQLGSTFLGAEQPGAWASLCYHNTQQKEAESCETHYVAFDASQKQNQQRQWRRQELQDRAESGWDRKGQRKEWERCYDALVDEEDEDPEKHRKSYFS